jgi:hypothetical protein
MQDSGTSVQYYYVPVSQVGFGAGQAQPMYIAMHAFPGTKPENSIQFVNEPSTCDLSTEKGEKKHSKKQRKIFVSSTFSGFLIKEMNC